ncbi:hypothetical protein TREMEDRAFT_58988 [Tremella mesenterica DSM 1558]|uniref:uncharacterized protein n=1 Tax=Tremella mesenterica (strain ATCC 24925 / CBS 8224 / DSM 1558 / NBRC 9311 / NRRL Y-6157 / RJB 2259-6 / UBC 559-6) TaxID=578456 RepID=UPI0003F48D5A|nr:uncharacterized protein TREMEDRAFT_58988 [Tremella mesenterica DSM 1558]EIW72820.1 hypothetical protein TREMEDRAFT_58988 [Tremella mesenterica DSM 1558]
MSSSSLSPLPPSSLPTPFAFAKPQSPSDTPPPARPLARRTYGRARPVSPPTSEEPLPDLFRPVSKTNVPEASPSKALLNRFSAGNSAWRTSLADLGAEQDSEDVEIDEEEMKREMARLKREARGVELPAPRDIDIVPLQPIKKTEYTLPRPHHPVVQPNRALVHNSSTSTLTALPPSSPPARIRPSSPADNSAQNIVEASSVVKRLEAEPERRSGPVIDFDDGSDADDNEVGDPSRSQSPSPSPIPEYAPRRKARTARSTTTSDENEEEQIPPIKDVFESYMKELTGGDEEEESSQAQNETFNQDPVGLFDDIEEPSGRTKHGKKTIKPLKKSDMQAMHSDLARMRREKSAAPFKPEPKRLPISSWLHVVAGVIKQPDSSRTSTPGLMVNKNSSPSSPAQITPPDDISAFTPSSANVDKRLSRSFGLGVEHNDQESSSPTPQIVLGRATRPIIVPTSEDLDDDTPLPGMLEMLEEQQRIRQNEEIRRANQLRLAERKAAALRLQTSRLQLAQPDEDDFTILPDSPRRNTSTAPNGPDAKAVLHRDSALPVLDRNRQMQLRYAGKSAKAKKDVTETFAQFAGQAWNHAGLKRSNGGAKPAGVKQGRDEKISFAEVELMMKRSHQEQVKGIRTKKEEEWGRGKMLPNKELRDMSQLLEAGPVEEDMMDVEDDDEEDDDEEDENYILSGEEDEALDEENEAVEYSGEEEGGDDDEEMEDGTSSEKDSTAEASGPDKENLPESTISEEQNMFSPKRSSIIRRPAFPIDDEETTPRAVNDSTIRAPLAEMDVPSHRKDSNVTFSPDVAGFGTGSPGFSQLFEATQSADTSTLTDAFAGLRDQPALLLPALLPTAHITETQARRDDALIAAEFETEADEMIFQEKPKQIYLNERGLFTQTRPQTRAGTPTSSSDDEDDPHPLAAQSGHSFSLSAVAEEDETLPVPSSTMKNTSHASDPSPTQETQEKKVRRLRRRTSFESLPSPSQTEREGPKNAFEMLMSRPKTKTGPEERRRLTDMNLFDEQAEESDEDNGWAPLGGEDEDEDGDEGYVPDLLNDAELDEEEKRRYAELAAAKAREIEQQDDEKREGQAKKIIEGEYRTKRRGADFYSDDDDDDGHPRRLSKKQRRKRMLGKEDGLDKLEGEANVFKRAYEVDLESDDDSIEEELPPRTSPTPQKKSMRDVRDMLKQRAIMNRETADDSDVDMSGAYRTASPIPLDLSDDEMDMTSIAISRSRSRMRGGMVQTSRSVESYQQFVLDESITTRRTGPTAGASVVVRQNSGPVRPKPTPTGSTASGSGYNSTSSQKGSRLGGSHTGSVLLSKGNKFI